MQVAGLYALGRDTHVLAESAVQIIAHTLFVDAHVLQIVLAVEAPVARYHRCHRHRGSDLVTLYPLAYLRYVTGEFVAYDRGAADATGFLPP